MIRLNSSDAFGSGSHPTTKGCLYALRMLQKKIVVSNFLDIGCGNGWLVNKVSKLKNCSKSVGVDGAKKMIEKAIILQ